MTNRNELERLLAAATEGPWYVSAYYSGTGPDERCSGMIVSGDDLATGIIDENEAPYGDSLSHDLDLICFLRNNAPAILALVEENARLRGENYKTFTDGMEAAAEICGSMAETTYDDADGFEAATGCEAAIMRVVKSQRAEQKKIARQALGETHDR